MIRLGEIATANGDIKRIVIRLGKLKEQMYGPAGLPSILAMYF
jgi:hypothetical protein